MADEAGEITLEQELQQFYKSKGNEAPAEPSKDPATALAKEGAAENEDPLEALLKEIPDDDPAKKGEEDTTPKLTTDQQAVLGVIPNAEAASNLIQTVENYNNFSSAFESRKFDDVVTMFERWDKDAWGDFLEHLYEKHVAKDGEWVTRFIAEQEGRGTEHKGMKDLNRKIAQLEEKLTGKEKTNTESERRADSQRVFDEYKKYVGTLFDTIKTPAKDRTYILRDLNDRVAQDPKVMDEVRKGNKQAVHTLFKAAVREFNGRDKEASEVEDGKLKDQGKKKTLLPSGANLPTDGEMPDDVRQVKKGEEDNWMRGKLNALFKSKGLGAKK